jgi:hypothetical protein
MATITEHETVLSFPKPPFDIVALVTSAGVGSAEYCPGISLY